MAVELRVALAGTDLLRKGAPIRIHGPLLPVSAPLSTTLRQVKSMLARSGAVVFTTTPPHKVRMWLANREGAARLYDEMPHVEFIRDFKLVPEEGQTLAEAGFAACDEIHIALEMSDVESRCSQAVQRVVSDALRAAKLRAAARAHSADARQTDLDADALAAVLLCSPHALHRMHYWPIDAFDRFKQVCRAWRQAALDSRYQWAARHFRLPTAKLLLQPDSPAFAQWWVQHADDSGVSEASVAALVELHAPQHVLVQRLRSHPEEGVALSLRGPEGETIDIVSLLALLNSSGEEFGSLAREAVTAGSRHVQRSVTLQSSSESEPEYTLAVSLGDEIIGRVGVHWNVCGPVCASACSALPLVEQVARIKEQLGIEAATLPEAVQQANAMMGLAGGGALPAQVEVLTAAIGLGQNEQPADADAQTGQHRCGCAVLSIWGNASWPMDMWSAHVIAVPAYFLKP